MQQQVSPLLHLQAIHRSFVVGEERIDVLRNINLDIYAGEMVAIMGASGSGKSTLMNILGCLDTPSQGLYCVNGVATQDLKPDELADLRRDRFGFIFQRYHLLSHLNAENNVEIPAIYAGRSRFTRSQQAKTLLQHLGLAEKNLNRPNQLSGGQQQRVAIARALVGDPPLILADEPTGNLDTQTSIDIMHSLQVLNRERNITILLVTHEPDIAAYSKRLVRLKDGNILYDGPAREGLQQLAHSNEQYNEKVIAQ